MKFLALLYGQPQNEPQYNTPEWDEMIQEFMALTELYKNDGVFIAGEGLQDVSTATSIKVRANQSELHDGPFAETKEQLGGFYLLDCKDLEEALMYAAKIPSAKWGTVEVRPVAEY
ncbi:YciI family protein [Shewanella sp. D64]|uniref:YciI family protein n=1 Tax=unclassified Shewanella TaxID=196818 RepID=UPI0022BA5D76|nr:MULTISPECIES: YciI family protein [unclassified Shewanella]MEC4727508.1 YciI family protein [Shewanella sp. D64]MEC4738083.1 YciI family protein [Shewanella sp. E94]WBJ96402.1 YciI family protein [Shewanella sp. MTB7]